MRSNLAFVLASLPNTIVNFPILHKHSTFSPGTITSKLSFILISIFEKHFPKSFHFTCLEITNIFDPVNITQTIECAFPIIMI